MTTTQITYVTRQLRSVLEVVLAATEPFCRADVEEQVPYGRETVSSTLMRLHRAGILMSQSRPDDRAPGPLYWWSVDDYGRELAEALLARPPR